MRRPAVSAILGMILCVVGAVSMFLPFASGGVPLSYTMNYMPGYYTWHGNLTIYLYVVLFGLLVAMSPLRPIPVWRSLFMAGVGASALLLMLLCYYASRWTLHSWQVGGWLNVAVATGLHVLCFVELYQAAARAQRKRMTVTPAAPTPELSRTEPIPPR